MELIIIIAIAFLAFHMVKKRTAPRKKTIHHSELNNKFQKTISLLLSSDTVILDTETTGLTESSEILEICIIDTSGNVLMNTLVKPKRKMRSDNKSVAVHKITNEMLSDAPHWKDIHDQFCSIIQGKKVLIYNSQFDLRLLDQTAKKYDLALPEIDSECLMMMYGAWEGTPSRYDGFKWHKLSAAAKDLNIRITGKPHRALTDCITVLEVLKEMQKRKPKIFDKYK